MLLKEKNAIITGSNRGIGKSVLKIFAANGANAWACARKASDEFEDLCKTLSVEYCVNIKPMYFDMSDADQMKNVFRAISSEKKSVDILVNNAGVIHTALFQMTDIDKMRDIMDVNYHAQMRLTQYISKLMARQKSGNIINISSSAAIDCNAGRVAYTASKAAVIAATKVIAKELGVYGIRVNAVAPGLTQTDMMKDSTPPDIIEKTLEQTCLKRVGDPDEIAKAILFLASDLSSYVTGQVLRVDGGMYGG